MIEDRSPCLARAFVTCKCTAGFDSSAEISLAAWRRLGAKAASTPATFDFVERIVKLVALDYVAGMDGA